MTRGKYFPLAIAAMLGIIVSFAGCARVVEAATALIKGAGAAKTGDQAGGQAGAGVPSALAAAGQGAASFGASSGQGVTREGGAGGTAPGAGASFQAAQAGASVAQGQGPSAGRGTGAGEGGLNAPGASSASGGRRVAAVSVQGYVVRAGVLTADRDTAGVVVPSVTSQVAAQVSGFVQKVTRQVGDWVSAGDVVVRLDEATLRITLSNAMASLETAKINLAAVQDSASQSSTRLELQLKSAQATLNSAQRSYDSQKTLFELDGISFSAFDAAASSLAKAQAELESAKTALEQNKRGFATSANQNVEALKIAVTTASNNLQQAELNLSNCAIKAPFAGQISAVNVAPGMYVGQSTSVFALVSAERQVNFAVAPADAPALARGTPLEFDSGGARYFMKVRYAPSTPVNGLVPLAALPTAEFDLPYGTVGNMGYRIALARGTIVPIAALKTLENRNYVFAIEGGKVAIRYVAIVAESGAEVALTGIEGGTVVILNAPPGLLQGSSVQPVFAPGGFTAQALEGSTNGSSRGQPGAATSRGSAPASAEANAAAQPAGQRMGRQGADTGTGTSAAPAGRASEASASGTAFGASAAPEKRP